MTINFEFANSLSEFSLRAPVQIFELVLFAAYIVLLAYSFFRLRAEWRLRPGWKFAFLLTLLGLGFASPLILRLQLPTAGGGLPAQIAIPLLGAFPCLLAAVWLGAVPAVLVGLSSGIAWAASMQLGGVQALEGALYGLALGLIVRQRQRGGLRRLLCQPICAAPLLSVLLWPIPFYVHLLNAFLPSADAFSLEASLLLGVAALGSGFLAGGLTQIILLLAPVAPQPPPPSPVAAYRGALANRLLMALLPVILLTALLAVAAIYFIVGSLAGDAGALLPPLLLATAGLFTLLTIATVSVVRLQLIPLSRLTHAAAQIARGDLSALIPPLTNRDDELGLLGYALRQLSAGMGRGAEGLVRLVEVSQAISARADLEQTLQTLLRGVLRSVSARAAGVYTISNPQGVITPGAREGEASLPAAVEVYLENLSRQAWRTAVGIIISDVGGCVSSFGKAAPGRSVERLRRPVFRAFSAEVAQVAKNLKHTHVGGEVPAPQREMLMESNIRALVVLPMSRDGRTIGTLWATWDAPRAFSQTDKYLLAALTNLAGIMIDNNQAYRAADSERSRLKAILNSTRDGIVVTDEHGNLQLANPAAEELLGFDLKVNLSQPLQNILNDDRLYRLLKDVSRGRGPAALEMERDARRLYISASRIEVKGQPAPQGWVLVMRDVTDLKRLDAMKTDFITTITHDLKSPLTFVRGYASMLKMAGSMNDKQDDYVKKILKGIDDLTKLLDELAELGEIANRVGLTMTPCQLTTIAAEVAESQIAYAEGKGLTLQTDLPLNMPPIIGDPRWLRQAIRNLVDNAIKYTNPPGRIKIAVQDAASSVVVTVADTGIGIAQADRWRIFEQFYRVRTKETLHIRGTGLGLSLVKKVTEQHGGQVWVESELGVGSVFYLAIPKDRRIADLLGEEEETPAERGRETAGSLERRAERGAESGLFL